MSTPKSIAIIGASRDRKKFGNKAVRAFLSQGWTVYPVHPTEKEIEGLTVFASVLDIPGAVDEASLYVPPQRVIPILDEIAKKGIKTVWFNPGTEDPEALEYAEDLRLDPVIACSIVGLGMNPHKL
ncbi:MAG: CoA-binding protein [Verrucomicrobiae bacterium]|nr:CoA-binding protein [Verrucomicrobiae bacterium]